MVLMDSIQQDYCTIFRPADKRRGIGLSKDEFMLDVVEANSHDIQHKLILAYYIKAITMEWH
jgi:hypothetical protein